MLMYKDIICFLFVCFIIRNVPIGRIRRCQRRLKCLGRESTARLFCETSLPDCFVLLGLKSSLVYTIFLIPTQSSRSHVLHTRCTWTRLRSFMPPMKLLQHFRLGNICVQFTLENRSDSCCSTYAIYAACQNRFLSQYSTLEAIIVY